MTLEECKELIKLAEKLELEFSRTADNPNVFGFYDDDGVGGFVIKSTSFEELSSWAEERIAEDKAIDEIVSTRDA